MIYSPKRSQVFGRLGNTQGTIYATIKDLETSSMCLEADINRLNGRIHNTYVDRKNLEKESIQLQNMLEVAAKNREDMKMKLEMLQNENFQLEEKLQNLLSKTSQFPTPKIETKLHITEASQKYKVLLQKQKEVDNELRASGPIDSLSTESVEEVALFDTQNLQVTEQINNLNSKIDEAMTPRDDSNSKLTICMTEYPEIQQNFPAEIKVFEGDITWPTIRHELDRIFSGFDISEYCITDYRGILPKTCKEARESLFNIETAKDNLVSLIQKQAAADKTMEDTKKELEQAQTQLSNEEMRNEKNVFQESEINIDIEHCDTQINSKRKEIERMQSLIAATKLSNGTQGRLKNDLQHNLNDLVLKEKPEIMQLSNEVEQWRVSLKNITDRLDTTEADLKARELKLKSLMEDKTIRDMIRMKEKKEKLEKKIIMLKHAIKKEDKPKDDYAQICEQNELKKRTLSEQVEKLERQHKDEQVIIKELSQYSDSLTAFLRQNKKIRA